jgi:hypothetical protein
VETIEPRADRMMDRVRRARGGWAVAGVALLLGLIALIVTWLPPRADRVDAIAGLPQASPGDPAQVDLPRLQLIRELRTPGPIGTYMSGGTVKPAFWALFDFHPFFCST